MTYFHKNLMPSDDELNQLLEKTLRGNPSSYPFVVFQIWFAQLLIKKIGELDGELTDCRKRIEDYIKGQW